MRLVIALLTVCGLAGGACFGQKLPAFTIADTGGRYQHVDPTHFKKPILLIYFLPDCGECQAFTSSLLKHPELGQRYQVIMVTNAGLEALRGFARTYRVSGLKGLLLGTEGWTNFLLRSQGVQRFPFVAVYEGGVRVRVFADAEDLFTSTRRAG